MKIGELVEMLYTFRYNDDLPHPLGIVVSKHPSSPYNWEVLWQNGNISVESSLDLAVK